jgi:thiamine-phosphate pyrophosphorylase
MTSRICILGSVNELLGATGEVPSPLVHPLVEVVLVTPAPISAERPALDALHAATERHDPALLVADDAELADALAADGIEIDWELDRYDRARGRLGPERSIGARVGLSRHRAMDAAEAGVDYVRFGECGLDSDGIVALVEIGLWWAEIFEVPCMISGLSQPVHWQQLARAKVDFFGVGAAEIRSAIEAVAQPGAATN